MGLINAVLSGEDAETGDRRVDPAAVRAAQTALEDPDGGPTRAALLVAELKGESSNAGRESGEAMALLAEACSTNAVAAKRMLDANVAGALASFLPPTAPKAAASLALRLLSALALHSSLTEPLVRSAALPPLLARLAMEIGDVGVQCAALLHNLADAPANRMRLLHAGALGVLTQVLVDPSGSGALKEHCLQAVASLAGKPECAESFPQLLGTFLAARLPGTQREALSAVQLIRERQPGIESRLAGVEELVAGLGAAAASSDAQVAKDAAELKAALQR